MVVNTFVPNSWAVEPRMDGAQMIGVDRQGALNFMWKGRFSEAALQEEKALKIAQDQYGPLHPNLCPILDDLGTLYRHQAKYKDAAGNYKWSLAIREKILGLNHPDVAVSLIYLASLDLDLGRYTEAELFYQRALKIQEKAGPKSLKVIATLQGLGKLYLISGKGAEALTTLNQCLIRAEKIPMKDDLGYVEIDGDLAQASAAQGDFDKAEKLLKICLTIRKQYLAPDRPDIAESMVKLANFYESRDRKDEAKSLYEQAAKIQDTFLAPNGFISIPFLRAASITDLALGRLKEAEDLLNQTLKLTREFYGLGHPKVAFCLEDMASLDETKGQKAKAVARLRETKDIFEKLFGPDYPEVLRIQKRLENLSR